MMERRVSNKITVSNKYNNLMSKFPGLVIPWVFGLHCTFASCQAVLQDIAQTLARLRGTRAQFAKNIESRPRRIRDNRAGSQ